MWISEEINNAKFRTLVISQKYEFLRTLIKTFVDFVSMVPYWKKNLIKCLTFIFHPFSSKAFAATDKSIILAETTKIHYIEIYNVYL